MSKFKDLFTSSCKEFSTVRCIVLCAMFCAISVVLGSFSFMIGDFLKISFTYLPNEFIFYLFGPFTGAIYGGVLDLLNYFIKPMGPYFPGFTISGILTGIIYGLVMYKRLLSIKRIIVANVIRNVFVDLLLNTYWLTLLYGKGFMVLLPMRALKALIMFPIETILLYMVIKGVEASRISNLFHGKKAKNSVPMRNHSFRVK